MVDRATSGAIVVTGGVAVALTGTFSPWLRSGSRNRSSYTIFDLVERLGFAPDGVVSWALRLWPLVPLVVVALTVAAWMVVTGHARWSVVAIIDACAVLWVGGTALAIFLAPDVGLFVVGIGPAITLIGLTITVVGLVLLRAAERPGTEAS